MLRSVSCAAFALLLFASAALAFDVEVVIKKVDADKGVIAFAAKDKDRSATVAKDAKFLDAQGKALADGLKSKELKEGTVAILSIEAQDNKPVIHAIKLTKKTEKTEKPAPVKEEPRFDTSKLVPLNDLGTSEYQGFKGGLYPDGKNQRPASQEKAGLALAKQVQPLDKDGKPSPEGKIVLLGIGFSNTVQCFNGFLQVAKDDKDINPKVVLVNGAVGGRSANMIQNPDEGKGKEYWETVDKRLADAGVTRAQVQVIWLKETNPAPHEGNFPKYTQTLQEELTRIVQLFPKRFPNAKLVYCSSRSYGGWAKAPPGRVGGPGNGEPYSYETGFAVKWLIEQQLKGDPALNFNAEKGAVKAPWLSWGPYWWANGENKRQDGFSFKPTDFTERDRMHHSEEGITKMGKQLLQFFKTDSTTKSWLVNK